MSLAASHPGGEACVCDLADAFDLSQPTISHHLKVLHKAGLLDRDKRGVWVYYRARTGALASLGALIGDPRPDRRRWRRVPESAVSGTTATGAARRGQRVPETSNPEGEQLTDTDAHAQQNRLSGPESGQPPRLIVVFALDTTSAANCIRCELATMCALSRPRTTTLGLTSAR